MQQDILPWVGLQQQGGQKKWNPQIFEKTVNSIFFFVLF